MYEVFNMGCRMEIYCDEKHAQEIIDIATSFAIDAQIIGRVEADVKKTLEIRIAEEVIVY
jgi:phosphoribosylformylglycinamidine cyclo-ligase